MKANEMVELFTNIPYTIDKDGHSHRYITHDIRCKLDNSRCTHCGHILRGIKWGGSKFHNGEGCVNKECIIYNHLDLLTCVQEER